MFAVPISRDPLRAGAARFTTSALGVALKTKRNGNTHSQHAQRK